jgi:ketosteroid isomerase-like protein
MQSNEAALAAMREVNRIFDEEVCQKKNFGALDRVYTRDADILPPGGEVISGLPAIKAFWEGACRDLKITYCRLDPYDVVVTGDTAYEAARGEVGTESGAVPIKYVVIWRNDSGGWKWHRDIWNMTSST